MFFPHVPDAVRPPADCGTVDFVLLAMLGRDDAPYTPLVRIDALGSSAGLAAVLNVDELRADLGGAMELLRRAPGPSVDTLRLQMEKNKPIQHSSPTLKVLSNTPTLT